MKRLLPLLSATGPMCCLRIAAFALALTTTTAGAALAQAVDIYQRPHREERSRTYDALHYRVHLVFDETTRSFRGTNTITLSPLHDGFTEARLDAETFVVDSVWFEGGEPLEFEREPHALVVRFPTEFDYGDEIVFIAAYHADDVDIDGEAYGVSSSYALGIGFKEETEDHPQLVNTLSFPRGARHWMPCYDHPNDRATNETLLTVREGWKALSNGRLEGVTKHDDGRTTWHWVQELPHPTYLYVAVAGPYAVLEDSLGSIPVNYWVYPKDVDDAMRSFERTPEILAWLAEVYGVPYPWIKYDQITIPGIGGGAESTTATVLGESTIHDEAAEQDFPSDWLVAHEAAHQWWGNLVSYRDWPQTWMSESFATYSEYLWAKHAHGNDEGAVNLLAKKDSYLNEARTRYMRPIVFERWEYPNDNFDRHTYQKGAVVLGMLRRQMGDGPFLRAIEHFLRKHAYQPVDTRDFMIAIKESTGQNLDRFFDQWVFSPGHPVLHVEADWDDAAKKVRLVVEQLQDTTGGVPVFRFPVDVRIVTEGGEHVHGLWMDERREEFSLDAPATPLLVRFDVGNHLLKEWTYPKSTRELLFQLANDDAIGRSWAAGQLSPDAPGAAAALERCAAADPYWHVRAACIDRLGGDPSRAAFLMERSLDDHSGVRTAALRALGAFEDPELAGFFRARFEGDDSYVSRAEALRGLGASGGHEDRAFLEAAVAVDSPRDIVRRAAEWALANM